MESERFLEKKTLWPSVLLCDSLWASLCSLYFTPTFYLFAVFLILRTKYVIVA